MSRTARAALACAVLAMGASVAAAQEAKVTPLMSRDLAAAPGKEVVVLTVDYPPGGSTGPHRHNAQTFAYVLEGSVVMQVKAGQERAKAFQQLVRRTGVEDIKALATMILQSERFGTSLAQALKVYADSLRNKRRLRAEAAVAKAGIKMLFPIVLFVLPALFVVTLVPGILSVLHDLRQGFGPPR